MVVYVLLPYLCTRKPIPLQRKFQDVQKEGTKTQPQAEPRREKLYIPVMMSIYVRRCNA